MCADMCTDVERVPNTKVVMKISHATLENDMKQNAIFFNITFEIVLRKSSIYVHETIFYIHKYQCLSYTEELAMITNK